MFKVILFLVALIFTTGCDNDKSIVKQVVMPEINDVNCTQENILKIADKGTKQKFAGLCNRRGSYKSSPQSTW
jgi:entry exclusion lipoprotein TrbK